MHLAPGDSLSALSSSFALVHEHRMQAHLWTPHLSSLFFSSSSRSPLQPMAPSMEIKQRASLRVNCFQPWLHYTKERRYVNSDFKIIQWKKRYGRDNYLGPKS
jgi:hypothetical protein